MPNVNFKWDFNLTTLCALFSAVVVIGGFVSSQNTTDAVQNTKIAANEVLINRGLAEERRQTREAIEDIKQQAAQDRAEMRRQFDKVNEKLDKLVEAKVR